MAVKPILFNTPMVRAIRSDIKTETRRLISPRLRDDECGFQIIANKHTGEFVRVEIIDEWGYGSRALPPQYLPGDILWVRENWAAAADLPGISDGGFVYMADYTSYELTQLKGKHFCWKPSIHMPKAAARTFVKVTGVWVERLQNITDEQCMREGIQQWSKDGKLYKYAPADSEGDYPMWPWQDTPVAPRGAFVKLWDSTVPKSKLPQCGFAANPWVWAYRFERCENPFTGADVAK